MKKKFFWCTYENTSIPMYLMHKMGSKILVLWLFQFLAVIQNGTKYLFYIILDKTLVVILYSAMNKLDSHFYFICDWLIRSRTGHTICLLCNDSTTIHECIKIFTLRRIIQSSCQIIRFEKWLMIRTDVTLKMRNDLFYIQHFIAS